MFQCLAQGHFGQQPIRAEDRSRDLLLTKGPATIIEPRSHVTASQLVEADKVEEDLSLIIYFCLHRTALKRSFKFGYKCFFSK